MKWLWTLVLFAVGLVLFFIQPWKSAGLEVSVGADNSRDHSTKVSREGGPGDQSEAREVASIDEILAESLAESLKRVQIESGFELVDVYGEIISGSVCCLRMTPELRAELLSNPIVSPKRIWGLGEGKEFFAVDGKGHFSGLIDGEEYFFWALSKGMKVGFAKDTFPSKKGVRVFKLSSCDPVTIRIVNQDGLPVSGIYTSIMREVLGASQSGLSAVEILRQRFFIKERVSGEDGLVHYSEIPEGLFYLQVLPEKENLGSVIKNSVPGGEIIEIILRPSFSIVGDVSQADGRPISEAVIAIFHATPEGMIPVASSKTSESGEFRCDSIACTGTALVAVAVIDGLSSSVLPVPVMLPGEEIALQFVLQQAGELSLEFQTSQGGPLQGVWCEFSNTGRDWIPYQYYSDKNGMARTKKNLPLGEIVLLNYSLGELDFPMQEISFEEDGQKNVVVVEDIGRYEEVFYTGEVDYCEFQPDSRPSMTSIMWNSSEAMPWCPSGFGTLLLVALEGRRRTFRVEIPDGVKQRIELVEHTEEIQFSVISGSVPNVRMVRDDGIIAIDTTPASHNISLRVPQGIYFIHLDSDFSFGPFEVPPGGVNLGALGVRRESWLEGRLLLFDGGAVAGIEVWFESVGGLVSGQATTNSDGSFRIDSVPSGEGILFANPSDYFYRADDIRVSVDISSFGATTVGDIVVGGKEGVVHLINSLNGAGRFVFLIQGGRVSINPVDPTNYTSILLSGSENLFGVLDWRDSRVSLVAGNNLVQGEISQVNMNDLETIELSFIPIAGVQVRAELAETFIPKKITLGGRNRVTFSYPPDMEGAFWLTLAEARKVRLPFPSTAQIWEELIRDHHKERFEAVDMAGHPIPGASFSGAKGNLHLCADARGQVYFPVSALPESLRVDAPRYWRQILFPATDGTRAQLREDAAGLLIQTPSDVKIDGIAVQPFFDLGYSWEPEVQAPQKPMAPWRILNLPEGEYLITILNPSRPIQTEAEVQLTPYHQEELEFQ
jgi:hypothetical protein